MLTRFSAHAIAIVALVFSMAGAAGAATVMLRANSVGTKQIRNGAVTAPKLAWTLVAQFTNVGSQVTSLGSQVTSLGTKVAADEQAPMVVTATGTSSPASSTTVTYSNQTASCPSGRAVVGGGVKLGDENAQLVNDSYPISGGWSADVVNGGPSSPTYTVYAICR